MSYGTSPSYNAQSLDFGRQTEDYSNITLREIVAGTSNLSLAQLVATRAAIQLLTLIDGRRFCRTELVPPGGGKLWHFQKVQVPTAMTSTGFTEVDFTGAVQTFTGTVQMNNPTLTDVQATLAVFPAATFVSDLAQRQSAVNLAEVIGISHGNAINFDMNQDIYTPALGTSANGTAPSPPTTSKVTEGTSGTAVSVNYTFTDVATARGLVEGQRGRPDTFVTYPTAAANGAGGVVTGWYPFVMSNMGSAAPGALQYAAALADYLRTGSIAEFFGMRLFVDNAYKGTNSNFPSNQNDVMAQVIVSNEAVGWAQAEDIVSEVQRFAVGIGFNIVTHSFGKSALIMGEFVASLVHA